MDQRLSLRTKEGSKIGRMGGTHLVVAKGICVLWVRLIILISKQTYHTDHG
jgi:hypothetical protein